MVRIAVIAAALAFLVAAARQSQKYHCGFTFNAALEIVVGLAVSYPLGSGDTIHNY